MNKSSRLFSASCVALIVTAMSFALRGGANASWAAEFHLSNEQVGWINGTAFWGFTLAMMFGGPLCDTLGLGRIAGVAFVGHLAGILCTVFAQNFAMLFAGTLLFGISNGSVEAACNPLIATLYADNKTTKLNQFHVWFPGGIVIGGLLAYILGKMGFGWRFQFSCLLIPTIIYGLMFFRQSFPQTERVQQGVSTGSMFLECLKPGFLLMVVCMFMTASTELGPQQWVPAILENAGVSGLLVLVWVTGLMAVGRQFAGVFVHKLSPMGMLVMSAVLSALGLFAMSRSSGTMLFGAATVFAFGVCFFWPTMLGYTNERFPKTGALGLAIMGGAGMLSVSFVLPVIGSLYDKGIAAQATLAQKTVEELSSKPELLDTWKHVQAAAGLETIGKVAILPVVLVVVFAIMYVSNRKPASH